MNNILGLRAVRDPQVPDHGGDVIPEDRLPVFKILSCRGCHDREAALAGNVTLRVSDGPIVAAHLYGPNGLWSRCLNPSLRK